MRARWILAPCLLLLSLSSAAASTAILVDTSRSIPPAQFEAMKASLAAGLPSFLAKGPVALYAFNDGPEKLVALTADASALSAGVGKLAQGGRFTLLYDCLLAAERDIAATNEPGVIVLLTDGKDENSVVTIEDVASRAATAHVAIVTEAMGSADEKTLRRLAVLTGGRFVGHFGAGSSAVVSAWDESLAALPAPPPPPPMPKPAAEPVPASVQPPPPENHAWLWGLALLVVVGFAIVGIALLIVLRRVKPPAARTCEECGRTLNLWESECPACLAQKLAITKPGAPAAMPAVSELPEIDPALLQKTPLAEMLENTIVLDQIPVLVLKHGAAPPRMFQLPADQAVTVGRGKGNTLSVDERTLSGQHFRVVPKEGRFYLVDLQSTNGTFLDGARVTLAELKDGARIRAGECEFTFRLEQKKLN